MTPDEVGQLFKIINRQYQNAKLGPEHLEGYHDMLADVPLDRVVPMLPDILMATPNFPPNAPAIRLAVIGTSSDEWAAELPSGAQAWEEVYDRIVHVGSWGKPRFSHDLIARTVKAFGWSELCQVETSQLQTLRAQVERFHNGYRTDAIAALKRGVPMALAILPHGEQKQIAGLVPVALPEGDDEWMESA